MCIEVSESKPSIEKHSHGGSKDEAKHGATQNIRRVVNAHIYLCVADGKSPKPYDPCPFWNVMPQCKIDKRRQPKMIGSMVGDKTKPPGAIFKKQANIGSERRIIAGTQPLNNVLKNTRTHHVGQCDGTHKKHDPPPPVLFEIENYKDKKKQIQRHPEIGLPEKKKNEIKKRIDPLSIDLLK